MAIEDTIARKLFPKYKENLTWGQAVAGIAAGTAQDKAEIVEALKTTNSTALSNVMFRLVKSHLETLAHTEAVSMMKDNSLDRTELEKIL